MLRLVLSVMLVVLLTACGSVAGPGPEVVKQAIALHLNQLQQELGQELRLSQPRQFSISHVQVDQQQALTIQTLPAFRVQGTYDLTLDFAGRTVVERHNPFEVYLQRQSQSWNWVQPANGNAEIVWLSQPLP